MSQSPTITLGVTLPLPTAADRQAEGAQRTGITLVSQERFSTALDATPETPSVLPSSIGHSDTPVKARSSPSTDTLSGGAQMIEVDLMRDAWGRHLPNIYTLTSGNDCTTLINTAMSSEAVRAALSSVVRSIADEMLERNLEQTIVGLGNAIRESLGGSTSNSEYGKMHSTGTLRIQNPVSPALTAADPKINKIDVIVQASAPRPDAKHDWTSIASFIEVKKSSSDDLKDATVVQCLRYVRKLFQYGPVKSHVHFVTWCGHHVRLWYVDAEKFACSKRFDPRKEEDQLDIGRIFCLLTLLSCRGSLYGRWDPQADPPQLAANADLIDWDLDTIKTMDVRPGPFRTRTAVWAGQTKEMNRNKSSMWYLIKTQWLPERLLTHEDAMLHGMESLAWSPKPQGQGRVPANPADFRTSTLQPTNAQEGQWSALHFSVLIFKDHLGSEVGTEIRELSLLRLHLQLVDRLLDLAKLGFHYRDLNDGNFRVLGEDTLLLIDYGNMRKDMSPRGSGNGDPQGAEALLDRARNDSRSANAIFLPTCTEKATDGIKLWNTLAASASEREAAQRARKHRLSGLPAYELIDFINALRDAVIYSHRYIDDLESAQYLHVWQVARKLGLVVVGASDLQAGLADMNNKTRVWDRQGKWLTLLMTHCKGMSQEWTFLMRALHQEISQAQKLVRDKLIRLYDAKVTLEAVEQDFKSAIYSNPDISTQQAVEAAFRGRGKLPDNEALDDIERDCFVKCSSLLRDLIREQEQTPPQ